MKPRGSMWNILETKNLNKPFLVLPVILML
jgi:hypothetical protein